VFPDPEGMLQRIKAKGLKICVWINSYIAQESPLFDEGMEKGYLLKRPDGSVWQWDMWQPGMGIVDFTNPAACEWFQSKLEVLLDMGVDCFKTDFGERIPTDCVYYNGMDPVKMHNYYTYLYNKTVFELLERKRGKNEAVLFARSATAGGQKFPVHWGGDCWSDYESMEESLRGGLSLQMSGFGFWSHDIGGFESTSTPDVYKRWCAFGLLSSHSRLHGSTSYRVPWAYDEESVDVVRFFTRLKARLMPYLWKTAITAHTEGIPSMRAMVLEYTQDKMCNYLDKQYMLGDSLLVAPIFNEEGIGEYYLPEEQGAWTNFFTGEREEGGKWYSRKYGYLDIPLMVRPNSVIAVGACEEGPEYDYAENVTFRVYEVTEQASAVVYDMDTGKAAELTVRRDGNRLEITAKTDKPFTVELYNVTAESVEGAQLRQEGNCAVLEQCGSRITCILK
ncbi:MAG: alpha-xylosidase, partial [Eubacteriaceae bacterium]|nr:alpha-xylosidase [Eubacteriaceae bacterium]